MPLPAFQLLEKKFEKQIRLFELKRGAIEKKIETHSAASRKKSRIPLDDEVRFIRSWIEKPLSIGAVTPFEPGAGARHGGLCGPAEQGPGDRARARHRPGDRSLGGTGHRPGPAHPAGVRSDVLPAAAPPATRPPPWCRAMPIASSARSAAIWPNRPPPSSRACRCSPSRSRQAEAHLRGFALMLPSAPFVQFTYATVAPIPKALDRVRSEASERHLDEHPAGPHLGLSQGLSEGRSCIGRFPLRSRCAMRGSGNIPVPGSVRKAS